jgi:hypothetical protein
MAIPDANGVRRVLSWGIAAVFMEDAVKIKGSTSTGRV